MSAAIDGMAGSYNTNSMAQMMTVQASIPIIHEAVDVLDGLSSSAIFIVADYGCSHGLNSTHAMTAIIEYLKTTKKIDDEKRILIVYNDLPTNDWTILFKFLNENSLYHSVASGRSFYELCLPASSLTIGYSSNALHWLSRKPCNLLNHCSSQFAQGDELTAFQQQAKLDLAQFLKHRSSELHVGGVLILTIWATDEQGSTGIESSLHLLYKCAQSIPSITQQELREYTLPVYIRSLTECIDFDLFNNCSFKLIKCILKKMQTPLLAEYLEGRITLDEFARIYTEAMCSWTESSLRQALKINGRSKENIDEILTVFWSSYQEQVKERPFDYNPAMSDVYLILKKDSSG